MTYDTEHYYAVQTFLEDDELCKIWNIIEIAMNREGYDVSNAELSMRLYDNELEDNIEHDMENLLWTNTKLHGMNSIIWLNSMIYSEILIWWMTYQKRSKPFLKN